MHCSVRAWRSLLPTPGCKSKTLWEKQNTHATPPGHRAASPLWTYVWEHVDFTAQNVQEEPGVCCDWIGVKNKKKANTERRLRVRVQDSWKHLTRKMKSTLPPRSSAVPPLGSSIHVPGGCYSPSSLSNTIVLRNGESFPGRSVLGSGSGSRLHRSVCFSRRWLCSKRAAGRRLH